MSLARLEAELIKVRDDLDKVKDVNTNFEKVLGEMKILRDRAMANPETKQMISAEMKNKEIIELFSSIEEDFDKIKNRLSAQTVQKEELLDFIETIRMKKQFSFDEASEAINFTVKAFEEMECTHVSLRPEFFGTIDLGALALQMKLNKSGTSVIVEKERVDEVLTYLLAKRQLRNVVLDGGSAKVIFKSSNDIIVEAESASIKEITRLK
jgi:hypothetical protein